jgi:hypothetical protein
MYRLLKRYHADSDAALIHRLRSKSSKHGYGDAMIQIVRKLYRKDYRDYGPKLFSEMLGEEHQLKIDHKTLRRWPPDCVRFNVKTGPIGRSAPGAALCVNWFSSMAILAIGLKDAHRSAAR